MVTYVRYWGSDFRHPHADRAWITLMDGLARAGWKPYLVCSAPAAPSEIADRIREVGTEIVYLPRARRNFDAACVWRVRQLCRHLHCDIIHCDNMHTSPLLGAALAGVPARLWSKRSMSLAYETMREPTWRDRAAPSIRVSSWLATKVLAVSTAVKEELVHLGIPSSKLLVLPNAVELSRGESGTRAQTRASLGYADGEIVFTAVGHAVPVKGWDVLVRAFAGLVKTCPAARLQLVGSVTGAQEQEHHAHLQRCVRERGIADWVRFRGHQSDITRILEASDVFVLPSRSEGYGNVLIEAMMCGLPCIATRVGCATDVIQDGVNGLIVARGSVEELHNAMVSLATEPGRRDRITHAVRTRDQYAPTVSEYAEQLVEICRSLLQQTGQAVQ